MSTERLDDAKQRLTVMRGCIESDDRPWIGSSLNRAFYTAYGNVISLERALEVLREDLRLILDLEPDN